MAMFKRLLPLALLLVPVATAQTRPQAPKTPRVYIFDCGVIKGLSSATFNLKPEEVKGNGEFFVPCYLIVHPKGTMMWDVGVIPDSAFKGDGSPATEGISTVNKPLLPQLAALGYTPADITYLAMSHYHSDHTANANAFAGSTWIVRQAERDAMFTDKPASIMQQGTYSALKNSKTITLKQEDYDVFGDGTVVIKSAPGHTPGHQVLYLKLAQTGGVLIAGDLYHYPEERTLGRFPTFEFSVDQSRASRAAIDTFLKQTGATMWIEHDAATNAKLKKAPGFYE
jgi:N-acyl homoserine lactone hydrolase